MISGCLRDFRNSHDRCLTKTNFRSFDDRSPRLDKIINAKYRTLNARAHALSVYNTQAIILKRCFVIMTSSLLHIHNKNHIIFKNLRNLGSISFCQFICWPIHDAANATAGILWRRASRFDELSKNFSLDFHFIHNFSK